jgi:hypothetical protein
VGDFSNERERVRVIEKGAKERFLVEAEME